MSTVAAAPRTEKARQSSRTRARLLRVARKAFAAQGYAGASLDTVARRAGVTTGAVYHQYGDKKGLFRAVLEDLESERLERVLDESRRRAGRAGRQSWRRLVAAVEVLLDSFSDPAVRQIIMIDGPAVLGMTAWYELRNRRVLSHLTEALEFQMQLGEIAPEPAAALAMVLLGALTSAGMFIAHAEDKTAARKLAGGAALRLVDRLRVR
jgi:AcrR family transcriptional regulator